MTGSLAASAPAPLARSAWRARIADLRLDAGLVTLFVASRVLLVIAAVVAEALIPRNPALIPGPTARSCAA